MARMRNIDTDIPGEMPDDQVRAALETGLFEFMDDNLPVRQYRRLKNGKRDPDDKWGTRTVETKENAKKLILGYEDPAKGWVQADYMSPQQSYDYQVHDQYGEGYLGAAIGLGTVNAFTAGWGTALGEQMGLPTREIATEYPGTTLVSDIISSVGLTALSAFQPEVAPAALPIAATRAQRVLQGLGIAGSKLKYGAPGAFYKAGKGAQMGMAKLVMGEGVDEIAQASLLKAAQSGLLARGSAIGLESLLYAGSYSTAENLGQLIHGDPKKAMENIAFGTGIGTILGIALPVVLHGGKMMAVGAFEGTRAGTKKAWDYVASSKANERVLEGIASGAEKSGQLINKGITEQELFQAFLEARLGEDAFTAQKELATLLPEVSTGVANHLDDGFQLHNQVRRIDQQGHTVHALMDIITRIFPGTEGAASSTVLVEHLLRGVTNPETGQKTKVGLLDILRTEVDNLRAQMPIPTDPSQLGLPGVIPGATRRKAIEAELNIITKEIQDIERAVKDWVNDQASMFTDEAARTELPMRFPTQSERIEAAKEAARREAKETVDPGFNQDRDPGLDQLQRLKDWISKQDIDDDIGIESTEDLARQEAAAEGRFQDEYELIDDGKEWNEDLKTFLDLKKKGDLEYQKPKPHPRGGADTEADWHAAAMSIRNQIDPLEDVGGFEMEHLTLEPGMSGAWVDLAVAFEDEMKKPLAQRRPISDFGEMKAEKLVGAEPSRKLTMQDLTEEEARRVQRDAEEIFQDTRRKAEYEYITAEARGQPYEDLMAESQRINKLSWHNFTDEPLEHLRQREARFGPWKPQKAKPWGRYEVAADEWKPIEDVNWTEKKKMRYIPGEPGVVPEPKGPLLDITEEDWTKARSELEHLVEDIVTTTGQGKQRSFNLEALMDRLDFEMEKPLSKRRPLQTFFQYFPLGSPKALPTSVDEMQMRQFVPHGDVIQKGSGWDYHFRGARGLDEDIHQHFLEEGLDKIGKEESAFQRQLLEDLQTEEKEALRRKLGRARKGLDDDIGPEDAMEMSAEEAAEFTRKQLVNREEAKESLNAYRDSLQQRMFQAAREGSEVAWEEANEELLRAENITVGEWMEVIQKEALKREERITPEVIIPPQTMREEDLAPGLLRNLVQASAATNPNRLLDIARVLLQHQTGSLDQEFNARIFSRLEKLSARLHTAIGDGRFQDVPEQQDVINKIKKEITDFLTTDEGWLESANGNGGFFPFGNPALDNSLARQKASLNSQLSKRDANYKLVVEAFSEVDPAQNYTKTPGIRPDMAKVKDFIHGINTDNMKTRIDELNEYADSSEWLLNYFMKNYHLPAGTDVKWLQKAARDSGKLKKTLKRMFEFLDTKMKPALDFVSALQSEHHIMSGAEFGGLNPYAPAAGAGMGAAAGAAVAGPLGFLAGGVAGAGLGYVVRAHSRAHMNPLSTVVKMNQMYQTVEKLNGSVKGWVHDYMKNFGKGEGVGLWAGKFAGPAQVFRYPRIFSSNFIARAVTSNYPSDYREMVQGDPGKTYGLAEYRNTRAVLDAFAKNPALKRQILSAALADIASYAPQIVPLLEKKIEEYLKKIQKDMPKTVQSDMFSEDIEPSDMEIQEFGERLAVYEHGPRIIFDHLWKGILTDNEWMAMEEFYPSVSLDIKRYIIEEMTPEFKQKASEGAKTQLAMIMDIKRLSPEAEEFLRSTFITEEEEKPGPRPQPKWAGDTSQIAQLSGSRATEQRRA
tara:strand:+ start:17271 stop:22421 length:5151 start_codon:yes stop_codon:yes gene_type:complete